jgi:hypothetical protein
MDTNPEEFGVKDDYAGEDQQQFFLQTDPSWVNQFHDSVKIGIKKNVGVILAGPGTKENCAGEDQTPIYRADLCLITNHTTNMGELQALTILLGTRQRWVVSFFLWLLYQRRTGTRYPQDRRLGRSVWSWGRPEKFLHLMGIVAGRPARTQVNTNWDVNQYIGLGTPCQNNIIILSRVRGSVTNKCGFGIWWLGLFYVTNTTTLGYINSHIQLLLDHESLTVVCILHLWSSVILSYSGSSSDFRVLSYSVFASALFLLLAPCFFSCFWLLAESESESYVTTDGQSVSLSWNKASICGLRPDFYYRRTLAGLLMWGLSLTRGRICRLQLLLALASAVILGSESLGNVFIIVTQPTMHYCSYCSRNVITEPLSSNGRPLLLRCSGF